MAGHAVANGLTKPGWWNWDHETQRLALPDFRTLPVEDFLSSYHDASTTPGQIAAT
jgi:hypothetical protein